MSSSALVGWQSHGLSTRKHRMTANPIEKRSELPVPKRLNKLIIRADFGTVVPGNISSSSCTPTTRSTSSGVRYKFFKCITDSGSDVKSSNFFLIGTTTLGSGAVSQCSNFEGFFIHTLLIICSKILVEGRNSLFPLVDNTPCNNIERRASVWLG